MFVVVVLTSGQFDVLGRHGGHVHVLCSLCCQTVNTHLFENARGIQKTVCVDCCWFCSVSYQKSSVSKSINGMKRLSVAENICDQFCPQSWHAVESGGTHKCVLFGVFSILSYSVCSLCVSALVCQSGNSDVCGSKMFFQ